MCFLDHLVGFFCLMVAVMSGLGWWFDILWIPPNSFSHQKSKIPSQLSRLEFELLAKKTTGRRSAGLCSV